ARLALLVDGHVAEGVEAQLDLVRGQDGLELGEVGHGPTVGDGRCRCRTRHGGAARGAFGGAGTQRVGAGRVEVGAPRSARSSGAASSPPSSIAPLARSACSTGSAARIRRVRHRATRGRTSSETTTPSAETTSVLTQGGLPGPESCTSSSVAGSG